MVSRSKYAICIRTQKTMIMTKYSAVAIGRNMTTVDGTNNAQSPVNASAKIKNRLCEKEIRHLIGDAS